MRPSIDKRFIVGLAVKVLRVSGVAGLVGFLLATAIAHFGANEADFENPVKQIDIPSASSSLVMLDQRRDRSDRSEPKLAKADLLREILPAPESTGITQMPTANAEIPAASELGEPLRLAPR